MNSDQKIVMIGAASGVICMVSLVALFYQWLPNIHAADTLLERVIFALRMNALAVLPLFFAIATVANARFSSKAIDPLRHAEERKTEINGRVVNNTLEQHFVFLIGTLALSTFLDAGTIKLMRRSR